MYLTDLIWSGRWIAAAGLETGAAAALDKNVSKALVLVTLTDAYGQFGAISIQCKTFKRTGRKHAMNSFLLGSV